MSLVKEQQDTILLHRNIRFLRKQMKLSQEELGRRIGLNRGNIASYENGSAEPKICNLLKLSNLFGVPILDLTKRDLSVVDNLQAANDHYQAPSANEAELIEQFTKRADELLKVINSIHTCFEYKTNSLDESTRGSKAYQMAAMKFEELFDASEELAGNHKALIDFVKCHIKGK
ncbi:helix-turn-helix domain-containing protein [Phaeodactylibacter xiamenensis]|uniref:HTH cro/C1-type domain-containing protein n=1 Tax=Phaeodactylibacter xiamenensis TaxID=1524460 RepID=A0A098SDV5_9BACT|nr:helix-turn-helix transcriptional regulator [Phaeodactylibacter xiamenensis]KGE89207.1 hypothetical protein IX84_05485 [Phaeodactylibacter xiamenensis]MCR9052723.1 helix-turn-helix domain-containing protein [bacterium]